MLMEKEEKDRQTGMDDYTKLINLQACLLDRAPRIQVVHGSCRASSELEVEPHV